MVLTIKIKEVFPAQELQSSQQGAAQKPLMKQVLFITTGLHEFMVEAIGDTVDVLKSLNINEPENWSNIYEVDLEFSVRKYTKEGETTSRHFQVIKLKAIAPFC